MPLNPNGNLVGTAAGELLWGRALVLGDGSYDNYSDTGNPGALYGHGGDDTIYGDIYYDGTDGIEGDQAFGGDGNDLIFGDTGPEGGADWKLDLLGSSDQLWGDDGDDTIFGQNGNDQIGGGTGNDLLVGGWGGDVIYGAAGNDTIYTDQDSLTILHATGWFNSAYGGDGDDSIVGGRWSDDLYGDDGADTIRGLAGDDDLEGGNARDEIRGGDGNDLINGSSYFATNTDVGDLLFGDSGNDSLFGGLGNDSLFGGAGDDRLVGDAGNDTFFGDIGNDLYDCGAGNDVYYLGAGDSFRFEYADSGIDELRSSISWTLGSYHERLVLLGAGGTGNGNALANIITGNAGNNTLRGMGGNDTVIGGAGVDIVIGNDGNDRLVGDAGNDVLWGNLGADRLVGGLGADRFVFSSRLDSTFASAGRDIIDDFYLSQGDRIDLRSIDARTNVAGDQAFSFIGGAGFTGISGQLRVVAVGADRWVLGDVNGDRAADFSLMIDDPLAVTASYFLL